MTTHDHGLLALCAAGFDTATAAAALSALERAHVRLADAGSGEFVCRWVDVRARVVPPEADTIIRTVTRTTNGASLSNTHWLEGIEPPPFSE
ncbi:MAG TPA: hypothetical protein VMI54_23910 [Polyangiaceae bacterium]|nr:hypothetical protein [Polyangiaceae bacterium]